MNDIARLNEKKILDRWRNHESMYGFDFGGWDLSGAKLSGVDFYHRDMTEVDFTNALINECNFHSATLDYARFVNTFATGASFENASLYGAFIYDACMNDVNFRYARLVGAKLRGDFSWADFYGANLMHAYLRGADLDGAHNIVAVHGMGRQARTAYFVLHPHNVIFVHAGCFWGTIADLLAESRQTHGDNSKHLRSYRAAYSYARTVLLT